MNRRQLFQSTVKAALATALGAVGFRRAAQAQSPTATQFPDSTLLPTPTPPFEGFIAPNLVNSQPGWPPTVMPPEGAPNVLLILIDDAGFGSNSAFGGLVPTPTLDKLARAGLRYTQMHNTALCSPTRAAMLTSRNHHAVGFGSVSEAAVGYPGYDSVTRPETAHGALALKENGYSTAWFGKNHNVPSWQASPQGPFDHWPVGQGYDYFYGFVGGDTSQWQPGNLFRNTTPIHGRFSGYGLYLKDGKPTFTMNLLDLDRPKWQAAEALLPGRHKIVFDWTMDKEGMAVGRGGSGTLSVNGKPVAERTLPHTQPFIWAWDETFDVGLDTVTPVDDSDYSVPFAFTGKLGKITFDLGETSMTPAAIKAMMEELAKKRDR
jgi:hypothetical protein